jgi:penicillin-binding protein 1B
VSLSRQRRYVIVSCLLLTVAVTVLGAFYLKYASLVDRKLDQGAFSGTFDIYAASPPLLVTNVSREGREKRRIVHFAELPKSLVDAVVSVEDKRFFRHEGFDPLRMMKAAYVDLRDGRREQGASTLSMQLARNLLLDSDKSWRRKIAELAMAMRLEQKLTKEQILEYYCNQVYLGRRATYNLHGFGGAARAYFDKDVHDLTLPEAATLAGLIQRPSYRGGL